MGSCWSRWWCCEREIQEPTDQGLQVKHVIPPWGHDHPIKMDYMNVAQAELAYTMLGSVKNITTTESALLATKGSEVLVVFSDSPSNPDLGRGWIQTLMDVLMDHQQGVGFFPKEKSLGTLLETTVQTQLLHTKQEQEDLMKLHALLERQSTPSARQEVAKQNMHVWRENHRVHSFLQALAQGRSRQDLKTLLPSPPESFSSSDDPWERVVFHVDLATITKSPALVRVFRSPRGRGIRLFDSVVPQTEDPKAKPVRDEEKPSQSSELSFIQEAHYVKPGDTLMVASRRVWDLYDSQPSTRKLLDSDIYSLDQSILTATHQMMVTVEQPGTIVLCRIKPSSSARATHKSHSKTRVLRPGIGVP